MRTLPLIAALLVAGTAQAFEISSPDVAQGKTLANAQVFKGFGCTGDNLSPEINWKNAPAGTKSFALTVYDPDAPTGSGWWHWVVYDIPASVTSLPGKMGQGSSLPAGAKQGRNDFGTRDFGGACPPVGHKTHRYIFKVHALKVETLGVPDDASAALIGYMLNANSLGTATLTAKYKR
ncbi:MAG TPA: YbhB/YbcL family Raf kinase inhibitor-like protein [Rhodocyclaceae bacterium]